jgi:hypothetical protein
VTDASPSATALLVGALADLRAAAALLRSADAALAARPTDASNARWFVRLFVLRKRKDGADAAELFWLNLEQARGLCVTSAASLERLFAMHGDDPDVGQLRSDLAEAGHAAILPALDVRSVPGEEMETSVALRPTVARMRICEPRMVSAIQTLATR